jgi:hypothetical protein
MYQGAKGVKGPRHDGTVVVPYHVQRLLWSSRGRGRLFFLKHRHDGFDDLRVGHMQFSKFARPEEGKGASHNRRSSGVLEPRVQQGVFTRRQARNAATRGEHDLCRAGFAPEHRRPQFDLRGGVATDGFDGERLRRK